MSGKYIVVFKDHVTASQIDEYVNSVNANGGSVGRRFDSLLNGFSATIPDSYLTQLQSLQGDVIDYIEPDQEVRIQ
ncbi:protease propeptide/inhibitor [Wolfiporia cocos MD-104 SS10]|uniref:Protease propeptide/inhibitor n=1 Tax=Wolfiporia cocos (strain MD-104) TaxID=742152 RepID=A0A2H3JPN0_WOLCO|nr:protease propeptide/inhibitor [Wolfiporia cocos MD-104 SS10]